MGVTRMADHSGLRELRAEGRKRERQCFISLARKADKSGFLARLKANAARRQSERGEPNVRY